MQLTDNFSLSEFECNDGTQVPREYIENVIELAENLQVLRDHLDKPLFINSAYRHEEYNRRIGGSRNSQHLTASAADIFCPYLDAWEVADAIEMLIKAGKMKEGGLGRYKSFTHYDIRNYRARWNG